MSKTSLLFGTQPLVVSRELAIELGLDSALVIQQFQYWLKINEEAGKNYFEEKYWTCSSLDEIQKRDFPFFSKTKLKNIINGLVSNGYLCKKQLNLDKFNHTNFYTINYKKIEELEKNCEEKQEKIRQEALEKNKENNQPIDLSDNSSTDWSDSDQSTGQIPTDEEYIINNKNKNLKEIKNKEIKNHHHHQLSSIEIETPQKIKNDDDDFENKEIKNHHHHQLSSIEIETPQKIKNDDDDFENKKYQYPSLFEIKEFIKNLEKINPTKSYISAEEFCAKMTALNWTSNGKKIQNWKAYYIRCCDNKQIKIDIENQKVVKKGKSYDFTTSGNLDAYEKILENSI